MHFTLRDYQTALFTNTRQALHKSKRVIMQLGTGGGKTKIFIAMTLSAVSKGKTVLIITESTKIFEQLIKEVPTASNINPKSKINFIIQGHVYIAMAQTLVKREHLIKQFAALHDNLMIYNDEAHVGTATKLLLQLAHTAYITGVTATPDFRVAKHLPILYNDIVVGPTNEWLVNNGYLAKYRHTMFTTLDLSGLQKSSTGDFTEESQERIFDKEGAQELLANKLRNATFYKAMIFCASIKSANSLGAYLAAHGIENVVEHSKVSDDNNLKPFIEGNIKVCISVGSMTKGFDFPPVDLGILWRATTSLPLYLQMIGRASRLSPETGKVYFNIWDFGGNGFKHQRWDHPHDWATMWNGKLKEKGAPPSKHCPECLALLHVTCKKCPDCGYEFVSLTDDSQMEFSNTLGEVKEVLLMPKIIKKLSQLDPNELSLYAKNSGHKALAIRVAKSGGLEFFRAFIRAMGYKESFFYVNKPKEGETFEYYDKVVSF